MANDEELLEMAHELYKRLGGVGSKDARIVRALWERWQIERNPTKRAADAPCAECGGEFLHKEGCSQELSFYEAAHR